MAQSEKGASLNWLITGGCGFIGSALVRALVSEGGHSIRVLDDLSVGSREDLAGVCGFSETPAEEVGEMAGEGVELVVGDILDDELALRAARGAEVVVHLAANTGVAPSVENPRKDCLANVVGTLNYLEAARHAGAGRFVFASSGAAVGEVEPPIHENLAPHPASPYGASKLAGEGYCSAYFLAYGLETVALRFGNVYGPGSGHKILNAVPRFISRAMRGEPLEIYGDGTQTRDFIYIEDLVRAVRLAAERPGVGGEIFQIATSSETTVLELVEKLIPVLSDFGIEDVEIQHAAPRPGDVKRNYSDTSKARRMLGWQAEVSLEEGLRRTAEWFIRGSR